MSLRKVTFPIRLTGGLETKADDKTVPTARLLGAENAVFTRGGTLAKRYGHDLLGRDVQGTSVNLGGGRSLVSRGSELLYADGDTLYSYHDDTDDWSTVGGLSSPVLTDEVIAKRTADQTMADCADNSGITACAWEDSEGGVFMSVSDTGSGRIVVAPRQLSATGSRPRVVSVGTMIVVFYAEAAGGQLLSLTVTPLDPRSAATATSTVIISDLDTSVPSYDVTDLQGTGDGFTAASIVWNTSTAGEAKIGYISQNGELGRPQVGLQSPEIFTATVSAALTIDVCGQGELDRVVAWWDSGVGVQFLGFQGDSLITGPGATLTVDAVTSPAIDRIAMSEAELVGPTGTQSRYFHVYYEHNAATDQNRLVKLARVSYAATTRVATFDSALWTQRGVALATRGWKDSAHRVDEDPDVFDRDKTYAGLVHVTTLFTTYIVMRSDQVVAARYLAGTAGGVPARDHLPHVQGKNSQGLWAAIYRIDLDSADDDVFTESGIRRATLDLDSTQAFGFAQLGEAVYIAGGGFLHAYDGSVLAEADFHMAPDDVAAPSQAAGNIAVGTYLYRFTYEHTNAQGEWVLGATSAGTSVTIAGSAMEVTFDVPTCRITERADVRIGVWRSETGDAQTLYRVTSLDPTATGDNGYLANDKTVDTVSFTDDMTDAVLISKEPLYTNGGILSNDPTPVGARVTTGSRRLFFTDPTDTTLVRYSQEIRDDYAVEMSPVLSVRLDPFGGDVTGIVEMDDAIIVFRERAIYYFAGPGPLANPDSAVAGRGFSEPQLITSDVGCTDARTIEYTPAGVMFQTKKGIHLLSRDRSVSYVGAPVEKFTDPTRDNQTFVDTDLIADRRQIRFLTSSGRTLLYDYYFQQWSEFSNHEGLSSVVVDDVYHYLRNDGSVFKENTAKHADATAQIAMRLDTAWIKLQDYLQGLQRIYHVLIVGEYKSAHTLRVHYQLDYEPGFRTNPFVLDPADFITTENYGDGNYGAGNYGDQGDVVRRYQFKIHLGQKCEAFRLRFESFEAAGAAGAAFELTELLITGGVKRGDYHMADSRTH